MVKTIAITYSEVMFMNNHVYSTLHARKNERGKKGTEKDVDQRKEH